MQGIKIASNIDKDDKWREVRKQGSGGTDAAVIAGLSRWKSPFELWLEKTGQKEDEEENERMYWGKVLEEIVAEEFEIRTGKKTRRCNFILQHPQYPFMLGNIDRFVEHEEAGLECKTAGEFSGKRLIQEDFLPEHFIQCQHYMAVTGYKKWYLACLIGGQKFIWKELDRDEQVIENLIKIESDFWKCVQDKIPPPPDGSESACEMMDFLYPSSVESRIELPPDSLELIEIREEVKKSIKNLEEQKSEVENKLKLMLQDNEMGITGKYKVIWKNAKNNRLDIEKIKEEEPDIYKKYLREGEIRRFSVKEVRISD